MREIVHIQAGQCGNQIGAKVRAGAGGAGPQGEDRGGAGGGWRVPGVKTEEGPGRGGGFPG